MRITDILLAVLAAIMVGYAVHTSVGNEWMGPAAGIITLAALLVVERMRRGGRRAR